MEHEELTSERRLLTGALAVFVGVAVLAATDLAGDSREGTTLTHLLVEGGVVVLGLAGAALLVRRLREVLQKMRELRAEAGQLEARLAQSKQEAERWRAEAKELLAGLSTAIDAQFERWALTAAEKEVALLLLKGLSHKELADARGVTEATARQQSRAVYKKAGVAGRSDLAAFFLEDLLLPANERG